MIRIKIRLILFQNAHLNSTAFATERSISSNGRKRKGFLGKRSLAAMAMLASFLYQLFVDVGRPSGAVTAWIWNQVAESCFSPSPYFEVVHQRFWFTRQSHYHVFPKFRHIQISVIFSFAMVGPDQNAKTKTTLVTPGCCSHL